MVSDPVAWAKKCVDEYGADLIVLQLKSIDPNDKNASAKDASATVKKVLKAIDVPLIIWGVAAPEKDEEVLAMRQDKVRASSEEEVVVIDHKLLAAEAYQKEHECARFIE